MRLRSLVRRLRPTSASVPVASAQADVDVMYTDANSSASAPADTEFVAQGIAAIQSRAGIVGPSQRLKEPCCRSRYYSPLQHAAQLLAYLVVHDGSAGEEITSADLQFLHGHMAFDLRWCCRPWNPVARELTRLTTGRKVYRRSSEPPIGRRERVFPIPSAAEAEPVCERVLGRASLFVPEAERQFLWPGPPTAEHCPHVDHPCPLWRPCHERRR